MLYDPFTILTKLATDYLLVALVFAVITLAGMALAAFTRQPETVRLFRKDLKWCLVWPYLVVRTVVEWLQLLVRIRRQNVARKN